MNDLDVEARIRDLLQKCAYSNDNFPQKRNHQVQNCKPKTVSRAVISVIGDNNIIIDANLVYTIFIFLIAFMWIYLNN